MAIDKKKFTQTQHNGLKIHEDGITFWFDFRIAGKRISKIWKANPLHTKRDRIKMAYEALEEFKREKQKELTVSMEVDLNATINDYFELLRDVKKWKEYRDYKYRKYYDRNIRDTLGSIKVKDVKSSHITRFNAYMQHKGLSNRSQKEAYEILIPLFNMAVEDEIIDKTPIKRSHVPKRNQLEEKKIITNAIEKYKKIYEAINEVFKDNVHHRAIFLFGFHGRRLNEVLSLEWEDIDFDGNKYIVRAKNSKVKQDMVFALPSDVKEVLELFRDSSGNVFNVKQIDKHYQKIREHSGIDEFSFHWMRNLYVSALAAKGVDVTHLSAALGHTDAGTLKKYLSLQRDKSTEVTTSVALDILKD